MTSPNDRNRALLIEQACGSWRPVDRSGEVLGHPAWFDLAPDDRAEVYRETVILRRMEAALDPMGLSTTGRAVLGKIEDDKTQ